MDSNHLTGGKAVMPFELGGIKLFSLQELSSKLKVSIITLRKYVRTGKLKAQKIGRKLYVSEKNLRAYLHGETQAKEEK